MERKFDRKVEQTNPTNPTGKLNQTKTTNKVDFDAKTIKEQQNKK